MTPENYVTDRYYPEDKFPGVHTSEGSSSYDGGSISGGPTSGGGDNKSKDRN